jgi:hypothetical protein
MDRKLTPEEADYSRRLFNLVLDSVIDMDGVEGSGGGFVRPDIVRIALLDVIATVDFNCGLGEVPSERRKTGEYLGKRYATLLKGLVENPEMRGWAQATPVSEH